MKSRGASVFKNAIAVVTSVMVLLSVSNFNAFAEVVNPDPNQTSVIASSSILDTTDIAEVEQPATQQPALTEGPTLTEQPATQQPATEESPPITEEPATAGGSATQEPTVAEPSPEVEEPATVPMPAVVLIQNVNGTIVTVSVPEGIAPIGTELLVTEVTNQVESAVEAAVSDDATIVESVLAFDIKLLFNGEELTWEEGSIDVTFSGEDIAFANVTSSEVEIYHYDGATVAPMGAVYSSSAVSFDTEHFSIYVYVGTSKLYTFSANAYTLSGTTFTQIGSAGQIGGTINLAALDDTISVEDLILDETIYSGAEEYGFTGNVYYLDTSHPITSWEFTRGDLDYVLTANYSGGSTTDPTTLYYVYEQLSGSIEQITIHIPNTLSVMVGDTAYTLSGTVQSPDTYSTYIPSGIVGYYPDGTAFPSSWNWTTHYSATEVEFSTDANLALSNDLDPGSFRINAVIVFDLDDLDAITAATGIPWTELFPDIDPITGTFVALDLHPTARISENCFGFNPDCSLGNPFGFGFNIHFGNVLSHESLKITKTFAEVFPIPDWISFTVVGTCCWSSPITYTRTFYADPAPGQLYSIADLLDNGWVLSNLPNGTYTVTETSAGVDNHSLTTTYSVNFGPTQEGSTASAAVVFGWPKTVVAFHNHYNPSMGTLVIDKKLTGVTAAQLATLKLSVTGPDDFTAVSKTFVQNPSGDQGDLDELVGSGVWDLGEVPTGSYTVTETATDITGYTRTTTWVVESTTTTTGLSTSATTDLSVAATTGLIASAAVVDNQETTVTFTNAYIREVGALIIDKKLTGVTAAQLATLKLSVTGPDDFTAVSKTFVPAPSGSQGDLDELVGSGVWDLGEVPTGSYTVTETATDITGYTRSTTWVVGAGTATTGLVASATVTADEDTTVTFTNAYSKSIIPKTGDAGFIRMAFLLGIGLTGLIMIGLGIFIIQRKRKRLIK